VTIRRHLRSLLALVVCATLGLATLAVLSLRRELAGREELSRTVDRTRLAADIEIRALEQRRFEKDMFLNAADRDLSEDYRARFEEQARALTELAARLRAVSSSEQRARIDRLLDSHRDYRSALGDLLAQGHAEHWTAERLNHEFIPHKAKLYELERLTQGLLDDNLRAQARIMAELDSHGRRALLTLLGLALGSVGLVAWLLLRHAHYIQSGLQAFSARIEDLASARRLLSEDLKWPRQDELGEIMSQMNGLLRTLRALYERVADGERSLDVTIRALGDGLISVDVEGRVTRLNPVAEALTGCAERDALGKPLEEVLDFIDAETRAPVAIELGRVAAEGVDADLPPGLLLRSRTGRERAIADSMRPIRTAEGQKLGAVMVFRDVTEQLAVERRLRHSEKMDAIGRLAGGIAHDFNNLLTGILGSTEILRDQLLNEEGRRCVDTIERSAESAAMLSSKLVAFARAGDKLSTPVHLHRCIEDVVLLMRHSLDKLIEIELELSADNDLVVGDTSQLQNALLNLGINARDAMPAGGKLTFTTSMVELTSNQALQGDFTEGRSGKFLRVRVIDSGSGIAAEVMPRIFEPFFTTKAVGQGTGMGLASVYGTLQDHHGAIAVESRPGRTSFDLYFPSHVAQGEQRLPAARPAPRARGGRVLVVDDEEILRRVARSILQRGGIEVLMADNGEQGLAVLAEDKQIDAVLLDIVMPVLGGRECFERIRELYPALPVILTSGFSNQTRVQELLDAGAAAFVPKPYRVSDLIQVVQQVLIRAKAS
jgi:PAS domain S-box-containing protein